MTTTFLFFCKSDFKVERALASSPLNGCLVLILWKTFKGAGRINLFDFTSRGGFSRGACRWLDSLLAVLYLDMVED